jgi:branched-chain amino acid transport system permease protein
VSVATIIQQLFNGVTLGGLFALIALGYTMVYGIILMINFAHSEMVMMGAYVGLGTLTLLTNPGVAGQVGHAVPLLAWIGPVGTVLQRSTFGLVILFLIVFLVSMVAVGLLGVLIERFAYRPLRHAPRLAPLISAIGVSIFLQNAVLLWINSNQIPFPDIFPNVVAIHIMGASMSALQLAIILTAFVLLAALDLFVSQTKMGKAMRATSMDREAAGLMGVDINSVIALAFFIGPAFGAVAGVYWGMYYGSIVFNMGFTPGIKAFTAAVLGGIGNLRGAMLGGFVLGIVQTLAAGFIPAPYGVAYQDVVAFAILILVLIFRPGGLLGEAVVEKV